jgi:hypothetical protein
MDQSITLLCTPPNQRKKGFGTEPKHHDMVYALFVAPLSSIFFREHITFQYQTEGQATK